MDYLAGDLLAFSGDGPISWGIKVGTCSPISHIGGIAFITREQLRTQRAIDPTLISERMFNRWNGKHLLFESTTLADSPDLLTGRTIKGVQSHLPDYRVGNYKGTVELFRLTDQYRERFDREGSTERLSVAALRMLGREYDGRGAIRSGSMLANRVRHFWAWRKSDRSSLFCSEYWASILQAVDLLPISDSSKYTPGGLFRLLVRSAVYRPHSILKGAA